MIFLTYCTKDIIEEASHYSNLDNEDINIDDANGEFASILAKSMSSKDIKDFIKQEALKEVDMDHDIIYHLIKNQKLKNGLTFREALSKYTTSIKHLDSITQKDPTLTILVPYLDETFNASSWNINKQSISGVVLRNHQISKNSSQLKFYLPNGDIQYIERFKRPITPLLVVKSNERLTNSQDEIVTKSNMINSLRNEDGIFAFFTRDEFNNLSLKTKASSNAMSDFFARSEKNFEAFFNQMNYFRDYIYYGIDSEKNIDEGNLDKTIAEYLLEISFVDQESGYHFVADENDPAGDWTDGNLEIYLDILLTKRDNTSFTFRKVVNVPMVQLFSGYGYTRRFDGKYHLETPLELFTWNPFQYGDTYKINVTEWDSGAEITNSISVTSTYSNNYSNTTSGEVGEHKISNTTGGTSTFSVTKTTSIKTTNNSEDLATAVYYFYDRTLDDKLAFYERGLPRWDSEYYKPNEKTRFYNNFQNLDLSNYLFYGIKSESTGTVNLGILPMKK